MSVKKTSGGCCGPKKQPEPEQPVAKVGGCCGPKKNLEPEQPSAEQAGGCCGPKKHPDVTNVRVGSTWNLKYFSLLAVLTVMWVLAYKYILPTSTWLVFDVIGLEQGSHAGAALEFFIYDTVKILLLLSALIYAIAWLRATVDMDRVRDYLVGKKRGLGYLFGASFGAVTPFCSCSSVPLFLGFTTARVPIGISMAFLITSPLINEVAVVLLWGLLGWKFAMIYVLVGITAGVIGGLVMDSLKAERWLQPFILEKIGKEPAKFCKGKQGDAGQQQSGVYLRHHFAWDEMSTIFRKVWIWVIIGVGAGAALHGFVPDNWFAENLGAGEWWSVPAAVFVAIPLYSNVTGIVPVMESLLLKGLPIGTTLAFCMSSVAASIPEVMMLRQIMTLKLQATFILYLWVIFTLVGWLFNLVGPHIL